MFCLAFGLKDVIFRYKKVKKNNKGYMKKQIPNNYLDAIKVTIVTNENKTFTKPITTWVTDKSISISNLKNYLNHPSVIDFELTFPKPTNKNGNGSSSTGGEKSEKQNKDIPFEIMSELIDVAHSKGVGCNKEKISRFNKFLDFDLHKALDYKYGFTGASKLHTIFKI